MRQQSALTQFGTEAQTTKERLLRAAANGTFLDEPPEPAPDAPGYRSGSTGKFVGYGVDEHQATRSTDTGRITDIGDPEPVPRSTLVSRYGAPDGATGRSKTRMESQRVTPQVEDESAAGFGDGDVGPELSSTVSSRAEAPVNVGGEQRDSMFSTGGGVQFNRKEGGYRETDRPDREVAPPDDALAEQDEFLSIERNERAAESAGVLQPEPDGSAVGDLAAGANPFGGK
jgi:hypothetical protein